MSCHAMCFLSKLFAQAFCSSFCLPPLFNGSGSIPNLRGGLCPLLLFMLILRGHASSLRRLFRGDGLRAQRCTSRRQGCAAFELPSWSRPPLPGRWVSLEPYRLGDGLPPVSVAAGRGARGHASGLRLLPLQRYGRGGPWGQGRGARSASCWRASPPLLGLLSHGEQQLPRAPLLLGCTCIFLCGLPGCLWKNWKLHLGEKVLLLCAGIGVVWIKNGRR